MPDGVRCVRLRIPDDLNWQGALNGALLLLTQSYNWELFGVQTPNDVSEKWWAVYQDYLDTGQGYCMIGVIVPFATDETPAHMLLCDGSVYNRVDYPALYDAIAFPLKIDADTFAVPNLQDRFLLCDPDGGKFLVTGGEETHVLTTTEMPSHSHSDLGHMHSYADNASALAVAPGELPIALPSIPFTGATSSGNAAIQATGGGNAHNNMPPWIGMKYAIIAE